VVCVWQGRSTSWSSSDAVSSHSSSPRQRHSLVYTLRLIVTYLLTRTHTLSSRRVCVCVCVSLTVRNYCSHYSLLMSVIHSFLRVNTQFRRHQTVRLKSVRRRVKADVMWRQHDSSANTRPLTVDCRLAPLVMRWLHVYESTAFDGHSTASERSLRKQWRVTR